MHTKYPTAGMRAIQIGGLRPAARVELPKWIWSKKLEKINKSKISLELGKFLMYLSIYFFNNKKFSKKLVWIFLYAFIVMISSMFRLL